MTYGGSSPPTILVIAARVAAIHVLIRRPCHAALVDPRDKREDDGEGNAKRATWKIARIMARRLAPGIA
jgi:hypothetical protein